MTSAVIRRDLALWVGILAVMVLVKVLDLGVGLSRDFAGRTAQFHWAELGVVGVVGTIAVLLAGRSAVIRLLPPTARLAQAALLGVALGGALSALDAMLRIGDINVGFPVSLPFYLWGAISQETLSHFAPTAIIVGLAAFLSANTATQHRLFVATALALSGLAAFGMFAAFGNPNIPLTANNAATPILIAAAVFVIELVLFRTLLSQGVLAALTQRLCFYAIWHVAWPLLAYA